MLPIPPITLLQNYVQNGLLSSSARGDLLLFSYTQRCVFERIWDPVTQVARGLILNQNSGEVIARPFPKFFNVNETEQTTLESLPIEPPEITEKLDGSLGILYWFENEPYISTKGSFWSDQAKWASQFLAGKKISNRLPRHLTLLFEIIYPENRIVVDYGEKKELILLAAVETSNGKELPYTQLQELAQELRFELVPRHTLSITELLEQLKNLPSSREGFVVRYTSGLRVKFKGEEYLRIHKFISHLNPKSMWEQMHSGIVSQEYLVQIPEEFRAWSLEVQKELETAYAQEKTRLVQLFEQRPEFTERKDLAEWVKNHHPKDAPAFFSLLDQKETAFDRLIMQRIKPKIAPSLSEE